MKTTLHICLLMMLGTLSSAQSNVSIEINHLLDGLKFQNEVTSSNDLGNDFLIDRLEYYLSGFSITHDGGLVTEVDDLYVLVSLLKSSESTVIDLGSYPITQLEAVSFHLGVDEEANHADPALLPWSHPLAPKFPSMHWGWAAGYRFIALEGKSGDNMDQEMQFHCIGNEYYIKLDFPVSMTGEEDFLVTIDTEYSKLLAGIDVSSGLILHGGGGEIVTLADNFSEEVFTLSSVTSTVDNDLVERLAVYPNPAPVGKINVALEVATSDNTIKIHDALGSIVYSASQRSLTEVDVPNPGLYFVSVIDKGGHVLATRKVVVH